MEFEFDERKSEQNKSKHGIDFIRAQSLWDDLDLLVIPARTEDEARSIIIGKIDGKLWSAIVTYRQDRIRIISVCRSRTQEEDLYES
jgi:hypothetical protein